jgi:ribonuclease HI
VREDSDAFALTTSSMTMEIMSVTRAMVWLETQTFHHVCFLSDSMSMLRKIKTGCIRQEWLEAIERSSLKAVCFIFVPGHASVKGNERADRLADMAVEQGGTAMDRRLLYNRA